MLKSNHFCFSAASGAALLLCLGCSGSLAPVLAPLIDPDMAAEGAISKYDQNSDGQLSPEELSSCPSLLSAFRAFDSNKDKRIDRDELSTRFAMWVRSGIGVSTLACRVTKGGRPLAGAQVELIPEEFFDDVVQPATGTTGRSGIALLAIDSAYLPDDLQDFRGVHQGLYRVVITHPSIDVPSKFNSDTTLGLEVSFETGRNSVNFKL